MEYDISNDIPRREGLALTHFTFFLLPSSDL